ncbi:unnamed protein product [Prorocentrum cordatum]|uniref:RING-type domain-containing protein n=1 Tax=Prorocentrum cordatum TaxID=2364126 RepID=A0ABN9V0V6_9DINO|nr:unnamed protein product [Polarella glacialis]
MFQGPDAAPQGPSSGRAARADERVPRRRVVGSCFGRGRGDVLGAGLGNTDKGAVIVDIQEHGLFDLWNRAHDLPPLRPGLIITEVNGSTGYWDILGELQRPGLLSIRVSAEPPWNAGPNWFQEITEMGKTLQETTWGGNRPFMVRLEQDGAGDQFSSLSTVRAGDCGVDQCAICMDDVAPDESLVQLPCRHAFHALCAARWLTQPGGHSRGKRQRCPLCCQKVVPSPGGGCDVARECPRGGA